MSENTTSSTRSAVVFQSLYLANLLLLPGISFLILLWLLFTHQKSPNQLSRWCKIHLFRAVQLSILVGIVLVFIPVCIVFVSPELNTSLMGIIIYFVMFHTGFVLIGMLNLARAMAKKLPLF